jgi:alkylated DNA repair protein alkB family protein 8
VDPAAPADPFPEELLPLVERLQALPGVGPLDQLTVNEYPPGVGLSPHVDTHSAFGDAIVSLSLAGPAAMALRRGGARRALLLPPRSALVLAGEARHAWDHYIPHRKADPLAGGGASPRGPRRVSLTFRRVRRGPCACAWPEHCDSQLGSIPPTRAALGLAAAARGGGGGGGEREAAAPAERLRLEEDNVLAVYDAIAGHFSATRFSVWPAVRRFLDALPPGALVADVGCGNGKYFGVRRDIFVSGSDRSGGLAAVAARRLLPAGASAPPPLADVAVADALRLPYRPAACDAALCIAVLHHLSTPRRRVALLEQLAAALAPGGRALVTVWATEQADMGKVARWQAVGGGRGGAGAEEGAGAERPSAGPLEPPSHDYLVPWHLPLHRADAAAAAAAAAAAPSLDAGKASLVFRRYYHLFGAGELEGLVGQVPGCAVVESFYDKDNWVVVFERAAGGGAAWAWDGMRTRG